MPLVLIVDDDPALLKLVSLLLKKVDAETLTAETGIKALEVIAQTPPDLVILDLMLPDLDGFEVLRRIRAQPALDGIAILILSAKAEPTTIRYGLDNGADGYVTKPYLTTNLIDRVQTLLNSGRMVQ